MGVIYKNSPLLELLAEVQWNLTPISVAPGAHVDPFYDLISTDLTKILLDSGYGLVENVMPIQVPKELTPWKSLRRFSRSATEWPKFQVGPGVFTVNMLGANYEGWAHFRQFLELGFSAFLKSYPSPDKMLSIKLLQLRYVNVFTEKHGFKKETDFASRYFRLLPVLPAEFTSKLNIDRQTISTTSISRFPVERPAHSFATIHVSEGTVNNEAACLSHFVIDSKEYIDQKAECYVEWMDQSHQLADLMFNELLSDELKDILLPDSAK